MTAWVNPAEIAGKYRYIVSDYNTTGNVSNFSLRLSSGQGVFHWEYPAGTWTAVTTKTTLTPGRWTHLAGVWDGTLRKIFVNGALEAKDGTPQAHPSGLSQVAIGRAGGFDGLYFNGEIDDVRIYARALGDAEVALLVKSAPRH